MKLRVRNDNSSNITVILEPWATEIEVMPGDFIDLVAVGNVPNDGYFEVESSSYGVTVYPEWHAALVHVFDSSGKLID
jgi:hypothetical protein